MRISLLLVLARMGPCSCWGETSPVSNSEPASQSIVRQGPTGPHSSSNSNNNSRKLASLADSLPSDPATRNLVLEDASLTGTIPTEVRVSLFCVVRLCNSLYWQHIFLTLLHVVRSVFGWHSLLAKSFCRWASCWAWKFWIFPSTH